MLKKIIMLMFASAVLASTAVAVTGCNTMAGAGKDIERGGDAITREANEHK